MIFETESPDAFADFIRDVAPRLTTMLESQPADVQERVWAKIIDAYRRFQSANGRVRTENQANWVKGVRR
ncbi:MAG: hypothetical protein ACRDG8_01245 [Actinomycetota bacterium]